MTILSSTVVATVISSVVSLWISTTIFKRNFRYQKYYDKLSEDLYELKSILGNLNFYIAKLHKLVEEQEEDAYSCEAKLYKDFLGEKEHLTRFLKAKPFVLDRRFWDNIQKFSAGELTLFQLWWSNRGNLDGSYEIIKDVNGLGLDIQVPTGPFDYNLISEKELSKKLEKFMKDLEKN